MVKNGDENKPIWFDEYGWNASPETLSEAEKNFWRHVTPQQQAQWTVQGIEYARKNWPWAGVISIWYFRQVGDIPPDKAEYYFQMVDPQFVPQPVYDSVKADAMQYPGPASQGTLPTPANPAPTNTTVPAQTTPTSEAAPSATTTITSTQVPTATLTVQVTPTEVLPATTATAVPPAGGTTGNPSLVLYIVGGLLVVGGLAGLGYYFMKNKGPVST